MADGGLPVELEEWVADVTGGRVVGATRHLAGASRTAWSVDVDRDGDRQELFLLRDTGRGGGSSRDAAVLAALAATDVPVPQVHGADAGLRVVLLERVPGRSDFPAVDDEREREPTAGHLMEVTAALHRLDPADLDIAHLPAPAPGTDHAAAQLAALEGVAAIIGDDLHPLFCSGLAWLRRHVPPDTGRTALVHSDMGPGNFLAAGGRVTAVLDWEVAHWGDPMEDLAAIAVRDMATPVGDLPTRYAEYEAAGGPAVDLAAVGWYRVLVLVRNSMLIGLGLGFDDPATDRAELTMYRTMLMRAAALALCDAVGVERPDEAPFEAGALTDELRSVAHAWRDQRETVEPALTDVVARRRAHGVAGVLGVVDHRLRFGADRDRRELDQLTHLLGRRPGSVEEGLAEVALIAAEADREVDVVTYVARHLIRESMLLEPLLGELADRHPQRLEVR